MKINQIACQNYSNKQNFCGRLAVNTVDNPDDIELINTDDIKYISKAGGNCFKTAIYLQNKGNIVVNYNLSEVLPAYIAACQNDSVTIDISSRYAK